jgi:hypothetical protein
MKYYDGGESVSGIRFEMWGFVPKEGEPWSVMGIQFVIPASLEHDDPTYFIINGPAPVIEQNA